VRTNLGHVSVCEVAWGKCLGMGCSDNREVYILLVGAFVEGELHLVIDAIFSHPIHFLLFLSFILQGKS
jgi:hypothetical protein